MSAPNETQLRLVALQESAVLIHQHTSGI